MTPRLAAALALICGLGSVVTAQIGPILPPTSGPRADEFRVPLPAGWFGQVHMNEMAIVSTVGDPPMLWLVAQDGGSLGALTFGRVRPDGRFEALVLFQGKQDERTRGMGWPYNLTGEFTIHIRNGFLTGGDDAQFVKVVEARHDYGMLWGQVLRPVSRCEPSEEHVMAMRTKPQPKRGEVTSQRVAAIAARGLKNPASLTLAEIRAVCASATTQRPDRSRR